MEEEDLTQTLVTRPVQQLVDPDTTKIDQVELEYEEVKANLMTLADETAKTITELTQLAKASQHHLVYAALANLIMSQNKTNRELATVIKAKESLIRANAGEKQSITENKTINNTMVVTTTELVNLIRQKNGLQE